jgi:hypothetical protein
MAEMVAKITWDRPGGCRDGGGLNPGDEGALNMFRWGPGSVPELVEGWTGCRQARVRYLGPRRATWTAQPRPHGRPHQRDDMGLVTYDRKCMP